MTKIVPLITAATKLITTDTACRFIPAPHCFAIASRRALGAHEIHHLLVQRVQAIRDPVSFHIDQRVAFDFLPKRPMLAAQSAAAPHKSEAWPGRSLRDPQRPFRWPLTFLRPMPTASR